MVQDSVEWLREIYLSRRQNNETYSLRAFARHTGLAPGSLSEVFAGRRRLTWNTALKIADNLNLTPSERRTFLGRVSMECSPGKGTGQTGREVQLDEDAFEAVARWPHYAVLSLLETRGFRSDPRWIGRRLGLDPVEVRRILERLKRLALIEERDGRWVPCQDWVTTTHDVPSSALRTAHHGMLDRAAEALEEVEVELRDITYVTMAIDPDKLPLAKQLIKQFRRTMVEMLECGSQREVYNLNIQLIPLTRVGGGNGGKSNA